MSIIFSECERSPSFKERHPKFRKSSTPDYLLVADHARTIKLNRQSSLSETSKLSDHTQTNPQERNNTLSSVDTTSDSKLNITPKSEIPSSVRSDIPFSQVSSSRTFPVSNSTTYHTAYEHLQPKGHEVTRPCVNDFRGKPMDQDPHHTEEEAEEEEGPIDFSMKKRPDSPPLSAPYRYTPLTLPMHEKTLPKSPPGFNGLSSGLTKSTNPAPVQQQLLVPPTHHSSVVPPPSYSASLRPPPPPYPASPSPPIATSTNQISQNPIKREPPPSYGSIGAIGSMAPSPPNKSNSKTNSRLDYHSRLDKYPACDSTRQDDRKIREVTIITGNNHIKRNVNFGKIILI